MLEVPPRAADAPLGLVQRPPAISAGIAAAITATLLLACVYVAHFWKGVPIAYLTQDATVVGNVTFFAGFLSNIGVLFWCATAAVCLFTAALLRAAGRDVPVRGFLLASGLLTAFLLLDDLFRLHETVFPGYLGIPELAVYAAYAALGIGFVLRYHARAFCAEGTLLMVAMLCLGSSVALDVFPIPGIDPFLLEDGFKLVGIVSWFFYFLRTAWRAAAPVRSPTV